MRASSEDVWLDLGARASIDRETTLRSSPLSRTPRRRKSSLQTFWREEQKVPKASVSPVRTEIRPRLGERREFPKIRRVSTKSELSWRPRRRGGGEARRRSRGDGKSGRRGARGRRRDLLRAVAARLSEKSAHGRHDWVRSSILGDLQREIYTARIVGTKSLNASSQLFQRRRTTP